MRFPQYLQRLRHFLQRCRRTQCPKKFQRRLFLEILEDRTVPSTITWTNRGNGDGFDAVFGNRANIARSDVDAALLDWQTMIANFNYPNGTNEYQVRISMSAQTGFGAATGLNFFWQNGGKPNFADIQIQSGADGHGAGWYLDPTPQNAEEFRGTIISPYTANATPGGPADQKADFYSVVAIEMAHAMGLNYQGNQLFTMDLNHYLSNTGVNDATVPAGKGTLWTYNGPDAKALFTSNNGGAGGSDTGHALHIALPNLNNQIVAGNVTYFGAQDTDVAIGSRSRRYTPSYLDALVLKDSYDYTIQPPTNRSMYINFDPNTHDLLVRGGSHGENIYPSQNNPSNDIITLDTHLDGLSQTVIDVYVQIGNPTPGTGPNPTYSQSYYANGVTSVTVDSGDGNDIINVKRTAAGTPTTVILGNGNNAVTVGDSGLYNSSPVTVIGGNGSNALYVNDQNNATQQTYTITNTAVTRTGGGIGRINYSNIAILVLNAGSADEKVNVDSTPAGTATWIYGGAGNNVITVGAPGLYNSGPVTVNGGGGSNSLTVDDRANATQQTYTVTSRAVTRTGGGVGPINYNFMSSLEVDIGSANESVYVQSTNVPLSVKTLTSPGGSGNDQVTIGSAGSLSGITAPVTVYNGPSFDHLLIDDSADQANHPNVVINENGITGLASAALIFTDYSINTLEVRGGGGNNTYAISDTPAIDSMTLDTGSGNDTVYVQATSVPLTVKTLTSPGGSGNDQVIIGSAGWLSGIYAPVTVYNGPSRDHLLIDDSADQANHPNVVINENGITGLAPAALNFSSFSINTLEVRGGGGFTTTYTISGTPANDSMSLTTGNGTNTVSLQGISVPTTLNGNAAGTNTLVGANANTTWNLIGTNAGTVSNANAFATFTNFGNLTAGGGGDTFGFNDGARISGDLVGGGSDTLDYSLYTTSVVVDLQQPMAVGLNTGIGGKLSGVKNVIGGSGAPGTPGLYNLLIGNGGNILTGGSGRPNILVAGASASTLNAGNGEDLLIGGTTNTYDTEAGLTSWLQIAAYWAGNDPFDTRVANVALGVVKLDRTTLTGNGGTNHMNGQGALALIYTDNLDIIAGFDQDSQSVTIAP
jgi:hypothetical protein